MLVDPEGKTVRICINGKTKVGELKGKISEVAKHFVLKTEKHGGGKIYGQVGFNYALQ
jgi:hypothetical protein